MGCWNKIFSFHGLESPKYLLQLGVLGVGIHEMDVVSVWLHIHIVIWWLAFRIIRKIRIQWRPMFALLTVSATHCATNPTKSSDGTLPKKLSYENRRFMQKSKNTITVTTVALRFYHVQFFSSLGPLTTYWAGAGTHQCWYRWGVWNAPYIAWRIGGIWRGLEVTRTLTKKNSGKHAHIHIHMYIYFHTRNTILYIYIDYIYITTKHRSSPKFRDFSHQLRSSNFSNVITRYMFRFKQARPAVRRSWAVSPAGSRAWGIFTSRDICQMGLSSLKVAKPMGWWWDFDIMFLILYQLRGPQRRNSWYFFCNKGCENRPAPTRCLEIMPKGEIPWGTISAKKMHSTLNMRSPLGPIDKLKMLRTIGSKTNYNFQWKMWLKNAGHFQEMKTNRDLPPAATGWLEWAARINGRAKIENTARMKSPGFSTKQFELSWCVFLLHVFFGLLAVHIS